MFDGSLRAAAKVSPGPAHVLAKMFATSQYAAMPDVVAHAGPGLLHLRAALFHLPAGGVVILGNAAHGY